jgi:nucleotide-binding universal stress UspA family protein
MKILLAIDSSLGSEIVVDEVAARPWPAGASVEALSVVEGAYMRDVPEHAELLKAVTRRAEELVQRAAERLKSTGLETTPLVLFGEPKAVIVDHAAKMGADWIVMGTHGDTALTRFLIGSVARAVLRHAPCSVEVVRAKTMRPIRILLATDGSESSVRAARSIAGRPWPAGTEVRILNKVELHLPAFRAAFEPPFGDSTAVEKFRAEAMKRSQDAILSAEQIVTAAGLKASEAISVLVSSTKEIILDEASNWGADLIVVGSHGRHGIDRFLLGSVSESVAMHAGCSVEVIR